MWGLLTGVKSWGWGLGLAPACLLLAETIARSGLLSWEICPLPRLPALGIITPPRGRRVGRCLLAGSLGRGVAFPKETEMLQ